MTPTPSTLVQVVEDDSAIRANLVDILELNGYRVVHAPDGAAGLELARREKPDVILTDISMPGMDGFQLIAALRAEPATRPIPVIIISAGISTEQMRRGMDLGAEDYLTKPFTEDQVVRSIRARLEKKALLDEIDAFAHTVAHDLKNPITVLIGRAGLLRLGWPSSTEAEKLDHVREIEAHAKRLAKIVDELLVFAGVQRQTVKPQRIDMAAVVRECLERVDNLVKQSAATVELPAQWPAALGHAPWIAEIWANYLSNGIKYGGTPPRLRLGADPVPERGRIRFWVQDNGAGLSEEQQSRLFRQFSRVPGAKAQGHGLGLSIVRRIAEKLGGAAGVESQPGSGSRFWFELPSA